MDEQDARDIQEAKERKQKAEEYIEDEIGRAIARMAIQELNRRLEASREY
jgi:hypothetical protein